MITISKSYLKALSSKLENLTTLELFSLGIGIYDNAAELAEEALILVGQQAYSRAFFLSVTALEELGKGYTVCSLSHQLLAGVPKDKLQPFYLKVAKLFRYHSEKIYAAGLTQLIVEYQNTMITGKNPILQKEFDDLTEDEVPELVTETNALVKPMIDWLNEQANIKQEKETSDLILLDERNQALYVDLDIEKQDFTVKTPSDLPRSALLLFTALTVRYIDGMEGYFELMRKYLEKDPIAEKYLTTLIETQKAEGLNYHL